MNLGAIRRSARSAALTGARLIGLGLILGTAAVGFAGCPPERRKWRLHRLCGRLARLLSLQVTVTGPVPERGLVVCNHLGYVDIIVLAAVMPAAFVAKSEVRRWPVFGWFARQSGTVFVAREQRLGSAQAVEQIRSALGLPGCVVLFPEGTSTGGETVLAFKSSLLEPAVGRPVAAAALAYALAPDDGDPGEEVCYWKDMTLVPHLLGLLGKRRIAVRLAFDAAKVSPADRKTLAVSLRHRVLALRSVDEFQHDV